MRHYTSVVYHKSLYIRHTGESRCPENDFKKTFHNMDTGRHTSGGRLAECVAGGFSRFLEYHCSGIPIMR